MRNVLFLACLVAGLLLVTPVQAQLRQNLPSAERAPARLFDEGGSSFSLNRLFSPEQFRMSHSYEMSMGSFGGSASSLGMYTNSMMWQFNQKLAARVDVSFAHSPFGGNGFGPGQDALGLENGRVFLRNAEIAYRPTENTSFHLSFRQSPYGGYMSPYGYGMAPGGGGFSSPYSSHHELFFRDTGR